MHSTLSPALANARSFQRQNPANTSDVLGPFRVADAADVDQAIVRGQKAAAPWAAIGIAARGQILEKVAAVLRDRSASIAATVTRESGKTLAEATAEVSGGADILEYYAAGARWLEPQRFAPPPKRDTLVYSTWQPFGLVGIITPWNFPVANPCLKLGPALLAGNAVVWKPAPWTAGSAVALADCFASAGVPDGVLEVVLDDSADAGRQIIGDARVAAISFTGSTAVGKQVAAAVNARGGRVQCEMGGKNAVVVLEDADINRAAAAVVKAAFLSAGQKCGAASRLVVVGSVKARLLDAVVAATVALRTGDPTDPATDVGPVAHETQLARHLAAIGEATAGGARLVCGGKRLEAGALAAGWFLSPAVLDGVSPDAAVSREELFGPILSVIEASDYDEAVAIANWSRYGLVASIYTRDLHRALDFAGRAEAGTVKINEPPPGIAPQVPVGGWKDSAIGPKELGPRAIEFFSREKTVWLNYCAGD